MALDTRPLPRDRRHFVSAADPRPIASAHSPFGPVGHLHPYAIEFDPSDVRHLSRSRAGGLVFQLVAPPELDGATLVVAGDAPMGHRFERVGSARSTVLWLLEMDAATDTIDFGIAFESTDLASAPVYWCPTGVTNAFERSDFFHVAVDSVPVIDGPPWAVGAVIYQIFPDRFANGDRSNDLPGVAAWGSTPDNRHFQGGDLAGIAERAPYLAGLGVDAVYLNPIFRSPSTHRYDTVDYFAVDPVLGGDAALADMVDALHGHDIKVILDASFNHVHPRFFAFADLVEHGETSEYRDWFVVHRWPVHAAYRPALAAPGSYHAGLAEWFEPETGVPLVVTDGPGRVIEPSYDAWYGVATMPRVNLANPDARAYMLDVAEHWVTEFDIDGWRMDVVRYVDADFWPEFRTAVRRAGAETFLLAEVMGDAGTWLQGDAFDATMNYTFRQICLDYFATGRTDTEQFMEGFLRMLAMYAPGVSSMNHNLLSSHDTARFVTEAGGDVRSLELATVFQLTVPGAPGLYYGDEIAMEGADDPGCRGAMDWEAVAGNATADRLADLAHLRRSHPALRVGRFHLEATDPALVYRRGEANHVTVAINHHRNTVRVGLGRYRVLIGVGEWDHDGDSIELGPRSAVVLG